jgi:hypothetical protein
MKKSKLGELKKELSVLTKEQQKAVTGGAIFNYGSGCQDGAGGAYKPNCYGPSGSYCQCW